MVAHLSQPGILQPCRAVGRSLAYRIATGAGALLRFSRPVAGGYYWRLRWRTKSSIRGL